MKTLVVTNDFPPRAGGIETYVYELVRRLPPEEVVVYGPAAWGGDLSFDAELAFPVVRDRSALLLPTPARVLAINRVARRHGCDTVWFGAAAPMALAAALIRRGGIRRIVASTHGHEVSWAAIPGLPREALRYISRVVDVLTYLGDYTRRRMSSGLHSSTDLVQLPPGVDTDLFHPGVDGGPVRRRLGLGDRPTILCVSRLVQRKGQDALIQTLPDVRRQVPHTALLVVGTGGDMPRLQRLAVQHGVGDDVVFTGAVAAGELPSYYAAGHVFAMPCRTRLGGLDVEGLGMVYLEASATGLPVIGGNSGGAPDAVRDGVTGWIVDGRSRPQLTDRLVGLLTDHDRSAAMGRAGRAWVVEHWRWDALAERLHRLLVGEPVIADGLASHPGGWIGHLPG